MENGRKPLSPAQNLKIAKVKIITDSERCKGCDFCIELCPKDVLEHSKELNARGAFPPVIKDEDACVGCGVCEEVCPDFAIFLKREEKR